MALTVYKASAGSGKTFTLAVEYIKLLIINPYDYRHILAVTFTNKATTEMKSRIISQLDGISKGNPSSQGYLDKIKEYDEIKALNISEQEMRKRAGLALTSILHDYSRFRIETIDSFFQSVVRELAHELDLTANLRVDLNQDEVLAEAVSSIIDDIENDRQLFDTVMNFIEDKQENNEKNWRINDEVVKFGKNIFNEEYLNRGWEIREKIGNTRFLSEYKKTLRQLRDEATKAIEEQGKTFLKSIESKGYDVTDFKYAGSGIHNFFVKLSNRIPAEVGSRIQDCLNDSKSWLKDKDNSQLQQAVECEYLPLLRKVVSELPKRTIIINTSNAILKHINHLMLLNVINTKVRNLNQDANRFLLADTAHFLNDLIDGCDIPFIYEKMGTRFNHIMIDEFQDTSKLQWENFKPLISNSLSEDNDCLIVGDVKQSIYRWRNSDWQILNNIENIDGLDGHVRCKNLKTNFRSAERIIKFNNAFFMNAAKELNDDYEAIHGIRSEELRHAYEDVEQGIADKNKGLGHVCVRSIKIKDGQDASEETLREMALTLAGLIERGVRPDDITILVRYNRYIPKICDYFCKEKDIVDVNIVSDEAFRLDFSATINLIISSLRFLADTNDTFALACTAYFYQKHIGGKDDAEDDVSRIFLATREEMEGLLPEAFTSRIEELTFLPLIELVEQIYNLLNLSEIKSQDAYMMFFHDQLSSYCEDNKTDLTNFLQFWDEELYKKTIPNGAISGIRIMSLHKSKGLEFHTVIMPYCEWETTGKSNELIWCEPSEEPFSELPLAPVDFSNATKDSIFNNDYQHEVLKNDVDNLNLLYVGFTRAGSNLFVISAEKDKKSKAKKGTKTGKTGENAVKEKVTSISQLINRSMPDYLEKNEDEETGTVTWTIGDIETSGKETEHIDSIKASFSFHETLVNYRQSNSSSMFIADEDTARQKTSFIDRGLLYHQILQMIESTDDIESAIDKAIDDTEAGGYFSHIAEKDEVAQQLHKAFRNPTVRSWFTPEWEVRNECNILFKGKNGMMYERRPDRVIALPSKDKTIVIDFKTGEEDVRKHGKQVSLYMNLLKQMGYGNVKGYVWYVLDNKIDEVN